MCRCGRWRQFDANRMYYIIQDLYNFSNSTDTFVLVHTVLVKEDTKYQVLTGKKLVSFRYQGCLEYIYLCQVLGANFRPVSNSWPFKSTKRANINSSQSMSWDFGKLATNGCLRRVPPPPAETFAMFSTSHLDHPPNFWRRKVRLDYRGWSLWSYLYIF